MEQLREKNVSERKLNVVKNASFDTLIAGILTKSEKAICTFIFRLFMAVDGEILAYAYVTAEKEIKRRAVNASAA